MYSSILKNHLLICYSPYPLHFSHLPTPLLPFPLLPSPSPSPLPPPDMALKEHVTSLALKKKVPHKGSSRRARKQRRQLSSVPWESNGASVPPSRGHHSRKPSLTSTGGCPVAENITDPGTYHLHTYVGDIEEMVVVCCSRMFGVFQIVLHCLYL